MFIGILITLIFLMSPTYASHFKYPGLGPFEMNKIMNSDTIGRYIGKDGYLNMAADHFNDNMRPAYLKMVEIYGINHVKYVLKWGAEYRKTVQDYEDYIELSSNEMKALINLGYPNWGTRVERLKERDKVLVRDAGGNYIFQGMEGYAQYATENYSEDMDLTFNIIISLLNPKEKEELGWVKKIRGTVAKYQEHIIKSKIRDLIFGPNLDYDDAEAKWFGEKEGFPKLIAKYLAITKKNTPLTSEIIKETRALILSSLTVDEKLLLGWRAQYEGYVVERRFMRLLIFGPSQNIQYAIDNWFGKSLGLQAVTYEYLSLKGEVSPSKALIGKVRKKIRAAVTQDEIKILGWDKVSTQKPTNPKLCNKVMKK